MQGLWVGGGWIGYHVGRKVGGERWKGEKEGGSGWFLKRGEVLVVEGREGKRRGEKKGGGETSGEGERDWHSFAYVFRQRADTVPWAR